MENLSFNDQMQGFERKLNALQTQCNEAERSCIVAETNLKSLQERQAQLIQECESLAGCTIDKVAEYLQNESEAITEIMARLDGIDLTGEITPEVLAEIEKIIADYSIA